MKSVLVICDDLWHPADVIEMGLQAFDGDLFDFQVIKTAKDILTPERIARYPVIINCKSNRVNAANPAPWFEEGVTEVGPKEMEDYVKNGGGFISLHAGNTAKEGDDYAAFVGNTFHGHPPRCGVDVIITGKHPVTQDVEDFHIRDEHYQIKVSAADATELFATTSQTGGRQIGGYAREIGKGRMCVLTPGHTVDVFFHPQFQKLLSNAIRWCAADL